MCNVKIHIKKILIIILILLFFIQISIFAYEEEEETDYIWLEEEIVAASNNIDEPKLNSRCAIAYDRNSKTVLFGKNENERVPMASTTKIMTAIVLLEKIEKDDSLSLDTQIEVCKEAGMIRRI